MSAPINNNTYGIESAVITKTRKGSEMGIINVFDSKLNQKSVLVFGYSVDLVKALQGQLAKAKTKAIYATLPVETSWRTEKIDTSELSVDDERLSDVPHGEQYIEVDKESNVLRARGGLILTSGFNGKRTGLLTSHGLIKA